MKLSEAFEELKEHGYQIRKLNECGGLGNGPRIWTGCGYGVPSPRPSHARYKKDSELTPTELKKRNDLRAKKESNKKLYAERAERLNKIAEKAGTAFGDYWIREKENAIIFRGDEDSVVSNLKITLKYNDNNKLAYVDWGTSDGWHIDAGMIDRILEHADEIKKFIAQFK